MPLFITGTDTNVGKTIIASWICLHMKASYWKPIQTGTSEGRDSEILSHLTESYVYPEAYLLKAPLCPQESACRENIAIDFDSMSKPCMKNLVIEGVGGILVPISPGCLLIDGIQKWKIPILVVARSTLGSINHTCLTLEVLNKRNIPILGVILNGIPHANDKRMIEEYGNTSVLEEFLPLENLSKETLLSRPLSSKLKKALQGVL